MRCPCKDCRDRRPACSGHCDRYGAWKAERDAGKAKDAAARAADSVVTAGQRRVAKRGAKYIRPKKRIETVEVVEGD